MVVHSVLVIEKNCHCSNSPGSRSQKRQTYMHFADNCLVDSLRSVGIKVPYTKAGPFWALKDGDEMLAPFGCLSKKSLCRTASLLIYSLALAKNRSSYLILSAGRYALLPQAHT